MKRLKLLFFLILFYLPFIVVSQIVVDATVDAETLIQDYLVGPGVTVSNVTTNGAPTERYGYFDGTATNMGINEGITLATKHIGIAHCGATGNGSGAGSEPDLSAVLGGFFPPQLYDVTVVEFDFATTGDFIEFTFVFASREYDSFVGSTYNDVFGFFLSGPGINGNFSNNAENISVLPNGDPVTINTVNAGQNAGFYVANGDNTGTNGPPFLCFGGYTTPITVSYDVQCGETYHLKIAIANVADGIRDSQVFFQRGSFSAEIIDATITDPGIFCHDDAAVQLQGLTPGGTWSGNGVSPTGMFDPLAAGVGTHTITHHVGTAPCDDTDEIDIVVTMCTDCIITNLDVVITPCTPSYDSYTVSGTVQFVDEPLTGTLIIEDTYSGESQVFNAPFTSPTTFSFEVPSSGEATTIHAYFSDDITCSLTIDYDAPFPDYAGTITATLNGQSTTEFLLCDGDEIVITSNGDYILPDGTNPGLNYGIYTCPPTLENDPDSDPCFSGYVFASHPDMTSTNEGGSSGGVLAFLIANGVAVTDNQIWIAPITMTDHVNSTLNPACSHVGEAVAVTYLEPIDFEINVSNLSCHDDLDGSIEIVNPSGGGGNYTYSVDGGATFSSNILFENLSVGVYDVVVQDENGCQFIQQAEITAPEPLVIFPNNTNETCYGACNAAISAAAGGGVPNYTWNWPGGMGSPNDFQVSNVCAGTYEVQVTDQNGCTVSHTFVIDSPDGFEIVTTTSSANCGLPDGSAEVVSVDGGVGNISYQWDSNAGDQTTASAENLVPGTYAVTISDQSGCDSTVMVTVGNIPGVSGNIVATQSTLCYGSCEGQATVSGNGANQPYTYLWNNGETNATATQLCAGENSVIISDVLGCTDEVYVQINEPSEVILLTSPDTTICIGGTAVISASAQGGTPGYTYTWTGVTGSGATHQVNPSQNSTYTVFATDANGCQSSLAYINVLLNPPLDILAIGPMTNVCSGDEVVMSAFGFGGLPPYTFSWTNNTNPTWSASGATVNYTITEPTVFTVVLDDACESAPVTAEIEINLHPDPVPVFITTEFGGCTPFQTSFVNTTPSEMLGGYCAWDFGDGNTGVDCQLFSHTYTEPGCYDVTLTVTSPEGCTGSTTYNQYICAHPFPDADFVFTPDDATIQNPNVSFFNQTTGGDTYQWDFAGLGTSEEVNPSFMFPRDDEGNYLVCLTATNQFSCSDSICKNVFIAGEFLLYIPNSFTPNGDNINDTFGPVLTSVDVREYEFLIFNRWGQLIFESYHPDNMWDGRVGGTMAKEGVYVWKIKLRDTVDGRLHDFIGHVTLLK
jgi:gliding motility-associated-like protein